MMRFLPIVSLVLLVSLSACTKPVVTGASSDTVIIKHDPALQSVTDLQPLADKECGRYGRKAVFASDESETALGFHYARFDCE